MNILIIGLGSIAKKHVSVIREIIPKAEIYALRLSIDSESYENVHNIYSIDQLKISPDFIIISNPSQIHSDAILQALEFNKPLFIEKPVLSYLAGSDEILGELERRKIISYVACNLRFHPALQFLKQYLNETNPRINEVNIYCGSYLPDWRPGKDFRKIYSSDANMGGGVHLDLIHELDYCAWLFGMPEQVISQKRNRSSLNISSIDSARFLLSYSKFTIGITLNYYRRDLKREIEIVSENDTLVVDLVNNRIESRITGEIIFEELFDIRETYKKQLKYFISFIQQNKQPMNSFADGIAVLKIALHE